MINDVVGDNVPAVIEAGLLDGIDSIKLIRMESKSKLREEMSLYLSRGKLLNN